MPNSSYSCPSSTSEPSSSRPEIYQPILLRRSFGLRESITITVGTVIGVGLFTVGANVVGLLGPSVIWATLAAMAISIYPALLYAEMGAALPFAGGTYQYASIGLSRPMGMLAGWNFIISMVSVASGEALAFSFYFKTLFSSLGILLPFDDRLIACAAILCFMLLGIRGIEMTGRMQNGFMFFFWGVAAVWILNMLPTLNLSNITVPSLSTVASGDALPALGFLPCVALIWWCFAGFETCCAMGEEIKHPQVNLPRALFLAPFIVFAVNGIFQWVLVCIVPAGSLSLLAEAAAPYAEGMRLAGVIGFPLILLCAGIAFGGDFSTLNASITAPARYLFTMARDGVLPGFFAKVHTRYHTPFLSVLFLGGLMLLLTATNSVIYIASLSLFATLFYYIIGISAAMGLRRKQPSLTRPYRAPSILIGGPVSILAYLVMITQLDKSAVSAGLAWCALGLGIYWIQTKHKSQKQLAPLLTIPLPPLPTAEEKKRLDQEFKHWRNIVAIAVLFVIVLYIFPYFL